MKVLFFSAAWCGACHGIRPMVANVCKSLGVELQDVKVDMPEGERIAIERNVAGLPMLVVLDSEGQEVARCEGAITQQRLIDLLKGEY